MLLERHKDSSSTWNRLPPSYRGSATDAVEIEFDKIGQDQIAGRLFLLRGLPIDRDFSFDSAARPQAGLAIPERNAVRTDTGQILLQPPLMANFPGFPEVFGFKRKRGFAADIEREYRWEHYDYPTHATNRMIMKMPTAATAVSAQDIPTRMMI
jgi:hypothetical protein